MAYKGIFKKKLIFFEWYMEKLIFVDKQKIFETIDFTGFTSTFSQNICFSFNGIYRISTYVRVCLDHFFAHILWITIFQIFENNPLLVVESFSTYYGEVPLQKKWLNVKFTLYYTPTVGAKFILHRRGIKITELCLVEIAEMHYLQWFEGGT